MKVGIINKYATKTGTVLGKLKYMVTLFESDLINHVLSLNQVPGTVESGIAEGLTQLQRCSRVCLDTSNLHASPCPM